MNVRNLMLLAVALLVTMVALNVSRRPAPIASVSPANGEAKLASSPVARGSVRPRLPAPRMPAVLVDTEVVTNRLATNSFGRIFSGEENFQFPTSAAVEAYLKEHKRSAESLLAASRVAGDLTLLREAVASFPSDPRIQLDLAIRGETPEEKRQALDAFRQLASDNPWGDYLSALDRFKSGRTDDAVKDLLQAGTKTKYQDYTLDHAQNMEEVYLLAGYEPLVAKYAGSINGLVPKLKMKAMQELAMQMIELQKQYAQVGDAASAQAVGQMEHNLAWQLQNQPGGTLLDELVGMVIEKKFLDTQSPDSAFGSDGRTVRDRLVQLDAQRKSVRDLEKLRDELLPSLPEREALIYYDRIKLSGESEAMRWLKNKHGSPQSK